MNKEYIRLFYIDNNDKEQYTLRLWQHEIPQFESFVRCFIHYYKSFKNESLIWWQTNSEGNPVYLEFVWNTEITPELFSTLDKALVDDFSSIAGCLEGEICVRLN